MPMLEETEYAQVLSKVNTRDFSLFLAEYERITGYRETNPNAIYHHRLAMYGPPCKHCGKPLRTPQAKLCGSCMKPVFNWIWSTSALDTHLNSSYFSASLCPVANLPLCESSLLEGAIPSRSHNPDLRWLTLLSRPAKDRLRCSFGLPICTL